MKSSPTLLQPSHTTPFSFSIRPAILADVPMVSKAFAVSLMSSTVHAFDFAACTEEDYQTWHSEKVSGWIHGDQRGKVQILVAFDQGRDVCGAIVFSKRTPEDPHVGSSIPLPRGTKVEIRNMRIGMLQLWADKVLLETGGHYELEVLAIHLRCQGLEVGQALMGVVVKVAKDAGMPIILHTERPGFYHKAASAYGLTSKEDIILSFPYPKNGKNGDGAEVQITNYGMILDGPNPTVLFERKQSEGQEESKHRKILTRPANPKDVIAISKVMSAAFRSASVHRHEFTKSTEEEYLAWNQPIITNWICNDQKAKVYVAEDDKEEVVAVLKYAYREMELKSKIKEGGTSNFPASADIELRKFRMRLLDAWAERAVKQEGRCIDADVLAVDPTCQKMGYGSALWEIVVEEAIRSGVPIILHTEQPDFYEHFALLRPGVIIDVKRDFALLYHVKADKGEEMAIKEYGLIVKR